MGGICLVLVLVFACTQIASPLYRDALLLITVLIVLLMFTRLMASYRCSKLVKILTLAGSGAVVCGQFLSTTEDIPLLINVPLLGQSSVWNGYLDSVFVTFGIIGMFCALILAVVELGAARDALAVEGEILSAEVAERIEAQTALAAHRDNLEAIVAQRTLELEDSQRALLAKERLAMLGEIMAAVSHEIRNPLGTVRSSLFTLKNGINGGDPERLYRAIERGERNIIRCDRIIEELLDLSRAHEIEQRATTLDTWLSGVLSAAEIPAAVSWEMQLQPGVMVSMDREKMRRALMNLINNSVQSFEEDTGREHRLLVTSFARGTTCEIRITDTGSGMSKEVLNQVGTPLFSTRAFGVGLGVPVVQETVRGHGGELSFESVAGKGTTVIIELPLLAS
jgi:signal transduction histidine kinase